MRYCMWNNKGGVGKSFLTFCLSTEYAIKHPDEIVVVADMCPQANVSEMLLGGNGRGQENQAKLADEGRTVADYIKDRYLGNRFEKLGTEAKYFAKVQEYNSNISENLYLLSGDTDLDLVSTLVSDIANAQIKEARTRAMSILKDVLSAFEDWHREKKVVCFIDCNPSFALYTELAIFASDRLIVPCTGDFASLRGINKVMKLLYNVTDKQEKDSIFNIVNFSKKAESLKLNLPSIYLGIINKARTFDKKVTVAYSAHVKKIKEYFGKLQKPVNVEEIKDCNNISLVVNYMGLPISKLEQKKYDVYGNESQVNNSQLEPMIENINKVVSLL